MDSEPVSRPLLDRLRDVAGRLGAADPAADLAEAIDRGFDRPAEDPCYLANALQPGALPFEWSFSELASGSLRVDFEPAGPHAAAVDRQGEATRLVRTMVGRRGTRADLVGFDRACERGRAHAPPRLRFGAFLGACIGAGGLREAKLYHEAGRWRPEAMRPRLRDAVGLACAAIGGLSPLLYSVSWTRGRVAERAYMVCRDDLRLLDLSGCLEELGLGHRAPDLILTACTLAGGRFVLPAGTTVLSLRELPEGLGVKLELVADPVAAGQDAIRHDVRTLLRQRPDSLRACDRWLEAVAPAGGRRAPISVASVQVTPASSARLSVYARLEADALARPREGALAS
jgi:hypothetical protein